MLDSTGVLSIVLVKLRYNTEYTRKPLYVLGDGNTPKVH